jgi:hypothetical protein
MPDAWFSVPQTGSGTTDDPYRPDLPADYERFEGMTVAGVPRYVVHVWGPSTVLGTLRDRVDAEELPDESTVRDRIDRPTPTADSRLFD